MKTTTEFPSITNPLTFGFGPAPHMLLSVGISDRGAFRVLGGRTAAFSIMVAEIVSRALRIASRLTCAAKLEPYKDLLDPPRVTTPRFTLFG